MTVSTLLLACAALLFTIVFGGVLALYIGGPGAIPSWFVSLRLLGRDADATIPPWRRAFGAVVCLVFLGLAQMAVVSNLDPKASSPFALLMLEQLAALGWLVYLAIRLARMRSTKRRSFRAP